MAAKEKLIRVFKVTEPYLLEYQHRTKRGKEAYERDKPVLNELIKEGSVVLVEKTAKTILYKYIGL